MSADKTTSRAARLAEWLSKNADMADSMTGCVNADRLERQSAAELRRLEASEAALLAALKSAHVRCPSKEFHRWRALIEATEEARLG